MPKLLTALLAAGFGLGLNAATALDIKTDQFKVDRPEQALQDKEQAASKAGTTKYATPSDTRSQSEQSGNASTPAGAMSKPRRRACRASGIRRKEL